MVWHHPIQLFYVLSWDIRPANLHYHCHPSSHSLLHVSQLTASIIHQSSLMLIFNPSKHVKPSCEILSLRKCLPAVFHYLPVPYQIILRHGSMLSWIINARDFISQVSQTVNIQRIDRVPSMLISYLLRKLNVSSYKYPKLRLGHVKQMCPDFQNEKKIWYNAWNGTESLAQSYQRVESPLLL